jgi:hypothetical protein
MQSDDRQPQGPVWPGGVHGRLRRVRAEDAGAAPARLERAKQNGAQIGIIRTIMYAN